MRPGDGLLALLLPVAAPAAAQDAIVAPPPPAATAMVTANPTQIAALLKSRGYPVRIEREGLTISSAYQAIPFTLTLTQCNRNRICTALAFSASHHDYNASLQAANDWNRTRRFVRSYIDDKGDFRIAMDLYPGESGMQAARFEEMLNIWTAALFDLYAATPVSAAPGQDKNSAR